MRAKLTDQARYIAPHQRFAAGQADFADAMRDETVRQQRDFAVIQQVGMRQKTLLFGHAIMAAEVAPVGDRYPQIVDLSSETINHECDVS